MAKDDLTACCKIRLPYIPARFAIICLTLACINGYPVKAGMHQDSHINPAAPENMAGPIDSPIHSKNGKWRNPPGSIPRSAGWTDRVAFFAGRIKDSLFGEDAAIPSSHLIDHQTARSDQSLSQESLSKATKEMYQTWQGHDSITWIGHATFLIRLDGMTILTDPFMAERASPLSWIGPKRRVPPALSVSQLPPIDVIIVSHNHYDHLCRSTLAEIPGKDRIQVVAPKGLEPFFQDLGYRHIHSLEWQQSITTGPLTIRAFPAVHWSKRGLFDTNATLWMSYAIQSKDRTIFHSGDTEKDKTLFRDIGAQLGKCDIALMAIGSYAPRDFMRGSHMTPEAAVDMARDMNCENAVPHHWGTIRMSEEPFFEPIERFLAKRDQHRDIALWRMRIGETRPVGDGDIQPVGDDIRPAGDDDMRPVVGNDIR